MHIVVAVNSPKGLVHPVGCSGHDSDVIPKFGTNPKISRTLSSSMWCRPFAAASESSIAITTFGYGQDGRTVDRPGIYPDPSGGC